MNSDIPRLYVAADDFSPYDVQSLCERLGEHKLSDKVGIKYGLEFFHTYPDFLFLHGHPFIDLKLHDIPTTVQRALDAFLAFNGAHSRLVTVHAAGGTEMLKAAVRACEGTSVSPVSVLRLSSVANPFSVIDYLRWSVDAGITHFVCQPIDYELIRSVVEDPVLITPGLRMERDDPDDHFNPVDPKKFDGDIAVVGRPITKNPNPLGAVINHLNALGVS